MRAGAVPLEQLGRLITTLVLLLLCCAVQSGVAGSSAAAEATDSVGLRKELLADVSELRKLFDLYMEQLASLSGPDAEEAMKAALEAVDSLDNALSLEKVRGRAQRRLGAHVCVCGMCVNLVGMQYRTCVRSEIVSRQRPQL